MKMCMRCGAKGKTKLWRLIIESVSYPTSRDQMMDQNFQLCEGCTTAVLDQMSVVISNKTWPGDKPCK